MSLHKCLKYLALLDRKPGEIVEEDHQWVVGARLWLTVSNCSCHPLTIRSTR